MYRSRRPTRLLLALVLTVLLAPVPTLRVGAQLDAPLLDTPAAWREHVAAPGRVAAGPARPLPAVVTTDERFGLVEAFRLSDAEGHRALGARWQRLMFWWSGLQAGPNAPLNPHYFAPSLLERERRAGYQLVAIVQHTPAWAAADPAEGPRAVPRGLDLPWDHADNYWGRFVERLARDYRDHIADWIVWNEPDIRPGDPNAAYYTWAGSVEQYAQLLRVAYRSIKRGNPHARVHLAGLTYWTDRERDRPQYFERLLDMLAGDPEAPAHGWYFDAATLHLYTDPRGLYQVPRLYRELMARHGLAKPIRINETNVIPWDEPTNRGTGYDLPTGKRCTLADQPSYLLQAFGLGLAGGAERLGVYKARDGEGAAYNGDVDAVERAALVREDGSPRPVFAAYQTAVRYFGGTVAAEYFLGRDVESVVLDRADNTRVTVLWNPAPRPAIARLRASGTEARLVDAVGGEHALGVAPDGQYAVALPPATCNTEQGNPDRYLMGGETYLVVEGSVPPGTPRDGATAAPSSPPH